MERKDETIKDDVERQLRWDARVDETDITVDVKDGIVTLEGTVPTHRALDAAKETSQHLIGVLAVDNRLVVRYPSTKSVEDALVEQDIKEAFRSNPDVDEGKIEVSVAAGVATLKGTTDSFWRKLVALGDAQSVLGVTRVRDQIAIVPTEKFTDEAIANDITDALERNYAVDSHDVDVTVEDGRVTLRGAVPSWYARREAFDTACFTLGVTGVEDRMSIEV